MVSMSVKAGECKDTVIIDSVSYPVGEQWCCKKIDLTQIADPMKLVRLPEDLCFQDYKIYVKKECREALIKMAKAAAKDSVFFVVKSGYRSDGYQKGLIKRRIQKLGNIKDVFKMVAPPGYSEHVTGSALDLASNTGMFYQSNAYRWLVKNAAKYGFYETYPKNNGNGVHWEPWHWIYKEK